MLGVDEGRLAAHLLRLRDHVQSHGGLAARLRSKNFDDAAARKSADAQRGIQAHGAAGDNAHWNEHVPIAETHDGAFAILFLDLRNR